ncbi:cob(I)yrinic acid a,c-diamide adenosyltransferase [Candidatus Peribacteria bacterium]|nr:cob(I)yrinic acid a,c-diamide adenosyltransferase [Candidatus Peribacteria bacterium]
MSIVTKTGDKGMTGLFGGRRVSKADARLHAYGTVDELNAILGIVLSEDELPVKLRHDLRSTQRLLFTVGADLATPLESRAQIQRIVPAHTAEIEEWIAALESTLPALTRFILPSGSRVGSQLHHARTVCRRAERWIVALGEQEEANPEVQVYLNRLGDYLFLAAREANRHRGAKEEEV